MLKNPFWDRDPITHALNIAKHHGAQGHGPDQMAWVIDQMVRALTSCPIVQKVMTTSRGQVITYEILGENNAYLTLIDPNPNWDKGIPG